MHGLETAVYIKGLLSIHSKLICTVLALTAARFNSLNMTTLSATRTLLLHSQLQLICCST